MKKILILLFVPATLLLSCDKVENPIPIADNVPVAGISWDDSLYVESTASLRKIVLEEFTGHRCSECPGGSIKIEQLVTTYGSQLIPVSFHAGFFAEPLVAGSGKYESDYRTEIGETFNNFSLFAPTGYPAGMVNRIELNGKITNGKNDWETIIQQIKDDAPKVKIQIQSLYDDSTRTIKEVVETEWLTTESNNYKLQVYVLENHIVDWQKDGTNDIATYDHKHVLRKALNTAFGTDIPSAIAGNTFTNEDLFFVLPEAWNVDNCSIVALVYDATTYEILQAEEIHIKE